MRTYDQIRREMERLEKMDEETDLFPEYEDMVTGALQALAWVLDESNPKMLSPSRAIKDFE